MLKISVVLLTAIMMVSVPLAMGYVADSPKSQHAEGTDPYDVICNESLELVIKNSDKSPACVKSTSVSELIERGWAVIADPIMSK